MWVRPKPDGSGRISALVQGYVHQETRACSLWMDGFVTFATGGAALEAGAPSACQHSSMFLQSRCQTLVQIQSSQRAHLGCGPAFLLRARTYQVLFGRAGQGVRKETARRCDGWLNGRSCPPDSPFGAGSVFTSVQVASDQQTHQNWV